MISNPQKALVFGVLVLLLVGSVSADGDITCKVGNSCFTYSAGSIRENVDCVISDDCEVGTWENAYGTYHFKSLTVDSDVGIKVKGGDKFTVTCR